MTDTASDTAVNLFNLPGPELEWSGTLAEFFAANEFYEFCDVEKDDIEEAILSGHDYYFEGGAGGSQFLQRAVKVDE